MHRFTLDPTIGEFLLSHRKIVTPRVGKYYSVNESNFARWSKGVQAAVRGFHGDRPDEIAGKNSRYIGSLVADFHRNLLAGGIFMYPADTKNPNGKLRLLYEARRWRSSRNRPGGSATDGINRILDIVPDRTAPADPAGDRVAGGCGVRERDTLTASGPAGEGPMSERRVPGAARPGGARRLCGIFEMPFTVFGTRTSR